MGFSGAICMDFLLSLALFLRYWGLFENLEGEAVMLPFESSDNRSNEDGWKDFFSALEGKGWKGQLDFQIDGRWF